MTAWEPFDVLDHLWQSTLFAAAVWLLVYALRTHAARVRYWLWLTASLKFLVPISLLMSVGERFAWRTTPAAVSTVGMMIGQVIAPATTTITMAPGAPIASSPLGSPIVLGIVWGAGVLFVLAQWWRQWRPIRHARRDARPADIERADLTILASSSILEPGVFGIWRPVLLVPEGIRERLTPAQLGALVAHEQCHVRYHDNLTAALHMAVEALFWFHPLVWWLEHRLIDERERACDEYVLQSGSMPIVYAEGILEVCRFATQLAPVCVAGVSGSDLRRRIDSILNESIGRPLGLGRSLALVLCAAAAALGPVAVGAMQSPVQITTESRSHFEVASIKRAPEAAIGPSFGPLPGGRVRATNTPAANFIVSAYGVPRYRIANMPSWLTSERYDLDARAADVNASRTQLMLMLRSLLEDRFGLRSHRETRQGSVFVLSVARGGHRLRTSPDSGCVNVDTTKEIPAPMPNAPQRPWCGNNLLISKGPNLVWNAVHVDMAAIADQLAAVTGRPVIDQTGIPGFFDIDVTLPPLPPTTGIDDPTPDSSESPFTVLREQLGLVLKREQGPVEYFVIDSVSRPTQN